MKLSKKLKILRGVAGYTQKDFSKILNIGYSTYQQYELEIIKPGVLVMQNLCQRFPEYTLWLMTDIVDIEVIVNKVPVVTNNKH